MRYLIESLEIDRKAGICADPTCMSSQPAPSLPAETTDGIPEMEVNNDILSIMAGLCFKSKLCPWF
jgi:hypothetical protein